MNGSGASGGGVNGGGMTAPEPAAGPLGTRRPAAGARREYLLTLLAGAVGAAVVLLAARQDWARVVTIEPPPLPASRAGVSGQDLVPAAGALGLAALAGLAAVLATRGLVRRIVGVLLAVFGVAIIASVSLPVTAAQVRGAAVGATAQAGGAGREHGRQRHHAGQRWLRGGRPQPGQPCGDGRVPVALGRAGRRAPHPRDRDAGRLAWHSLAGHVQPLRAASQPEAVRCGGPGHSLGIAEPGARPH